MRGVVNDGRLGSLLCGAIMARGSGMNGWRRLWLVMMVMRAWSTGLTISCAIDVGLCQINFRDLQATERQQYAQQGCCHFDDFCCFHFVLHDLALVSKKVINRFKKPKLQKMIVFSLFTKPLIYLLSLR